jgi:hypothetical protein
MRSSRWKSPPSLVGHHRRPGESLLCASTCLSLLLCHDAGLLPVDWHRASSSSHTLIVELQGRLLAWERELDSRERFLMAHKDGLVAFERSLGRARMECDDECD